MNYAAAVISGLLASSFTEYVLHRFYLHGRKGHSHIIKHHRDFNGQHSFEARGVPVSEIVSSPGYIFTNAAIYLPAGLLFFQSGFIPGSIFLLSGAGYTLWLEWAHLKFHSPSGTLFEKTALYGKLKKHHRTHHIVYKKNYSIGSVWWDYFFFTAAKKNGADRRKL